ncbi:MAG TPA: cyclic nucleotide-binding domain-containing protein [Fibrobacteraceae bacterium]|nr:cyclic nucleotide-binding domain-containing protein [Fibrobacteraceae bacterium]
MFHAFWSSWFTGDAKRRALHETLAEIPVFADLGVFELRFLVPILHQREYQAGELVFREGEAGNGMYIIQSGQVDVLGQNTEGASVLYARLSERQFFGEISLVDDQPRSASVVCATRSTLYGFFKPDLLELIDKHPAIGTKILFNLAHVLGHRLRDSNTKLMELQAQIAAMRGGHASS